MSTEERPPVSVVVPFKGDDAAARLLLEALESIETIEGDELIGADNTPDGTLVGAAVGRRVQVVQAPDQASSYHARNIGAELAKNPWILFTDSDCQPHPSILRDYFNRQIDARCGAITGEVMGMPGQDHVVARYARSRHHMEQAGHMTSSIKPFGATVNLLVRREAWLDIGGFCEGIRTAGDQDFCWRLQDRGWTIDYAPNAIVSHAHRESVRGLAEQWRRYGTAVAWLRRRHPGTYVSASTTRSLAGSVRLLVGAAGPLLRGRREEAAFTALDAVVAGASTIGALMGNRAQTRIESEPRLVAVTATFPETNAPLTASHVEADRRPDQPRPWLVRGISSSYAEDDGPARRALAFTWLFLRHPVRLAAAARVDGDRPLHALAPTARRLARALDKGASWEAAPGRSTDAERLQILVGVPPVR